MQGLTITLCALGTGIMAGLYGLKEIGKISTYSLFYIGWMIAGALMLLTAVIIDMQTDVMGGWAVQIPLFIGSTWLMGLLFRRRK